MLEEYQKVLSKLKGKERVEYKALMYAKVYGGNHASIRDSTLVRGLIGETGPRKFCWGIDPYKPETPKLLLICG